jgi:hypothetical protein
MFGISNHALHAAAECIAEWYAQVAYMMTAVTQLSCQPHFHLQSACKAHAKQALLSLRVAEANTQTAYAGCILVSTNATHPGQMQNMSPPGAALAQKTPGALAHNPAIWPDIHACNQITATQTCTKAMLNTTQTAVHCTAPSRPALKKLLKLHTPSACQTTLPDRKRYQGFVVEPCVASFVWC